MMRTLVVKGLILEKKFGDDTSEIIYSIPKFHYNSLHYIFIIIRNICFNFFLGNVPILYPQQTPYNLWFQSKKNGHIGPKWAY